MSVSLSLGVTNAAVNVLDKDYTARISLSGLIKEITSIIDPVILIDMTGIEDAEHNPITPVGCNYAYISDFSRYYFIRDIKNVSDMMWEIYLHVDVLKTYKNAIVTSPCIVSKSYNVFNMYLNDSNYKCYQNDHVLMTKFPSGFPIDDAHFVLTCFGKKESS